MSNQMDDLYDFAMTYVNKGDLRRGLQVLTDLAQRGHMPSQYQIGKIYIEQSQQQGDDAYKAGMSWMTASAQSGFELAKSFLGVGSDDASKEEATGEEIFKADKLIYIVVCQVQSQDGWGTNLQGIGSYPLTIIENTKTGEQIGFIGSEAIDGAELLLEKDDVRGEYLNRFGLEDFNEATGQGVEDSYLNELISASIYKDGDDFEFENEVSLTILDGEGTIYDEQELEPHMGKFGIWTMTRDNLDISFDVSTKKLTIDGNAVEDLGVATEEYLSGNGDMSAALIDA